MSRDRHPLLRSLTVAARQKLFPRHILPLILSFSNGPSKGGFATPFVSSVSLIRPRGSVVDCTRPGPSTKSTRPSL